MIPDTRGEHRRENGAELLGYIASAMTLSKHEPPSVIRWEQCPTRTMQTRFWSQSA